MLNDYEMGMLVMWLRHNLSVEQKDRLSLDAPSVANMVYPGVENTRGLPWATYREVVSLLRAGEKIKAIKAVRNYNKMDLIDAKNLVESIKVS